MRRRRRIRRKTTGADPRVVRQRSPRQTPKMADAHSLCLDSFGAVLPATLHILVRISIRGGIPAGASPGALKIGAKSEAKFGTFSV